MSACDGWVVVGIGLRGGCRALPAAAMSVERVTHGGRDGDGSVLHGVDEAAAEADVALIENGALAGRGRPLRLVEAKREVLSETYSSLQGSSGWR